MRYIEDENGMPVLELTQRNLLTLLNKVGEPSSAKTLIDPDNKIAVRAVADKVHYADREPGEVVRFGPTREDGRVVHLPMSFTPGGHPWLVSADTACGARLTHNNFVFYPWEVEGVTCQDCLGTFGLQQDPVPAA